MRGKKVKRILISGIISQTVTLALGIVLPYLLIGGFGSEVNGLLSSIRQIFVYVALLEAGVGTAALQAMYSPVAAGDKTKVCEIMSATHHYFRRTGWMYALCVVFLAFVYPFIFHINLSHSLVAAIILLQGGANVIRYFFQGKLAILLRVDGRSYVTTNIQTLITILSYTTQIVLIVSGSGIICVMVGYFLVNLCQMFLVMRYVRKNYPWLNVSAKPDFKAIAQSQFVIIHHFSGLIFNNTDILLLSYFCGLQVVSVYSLYSLIYNSVATLIDTLCTSVEHVLGQAFNSDREKFIKLQEAYETYYLCIAFALFSITLIMIPSFMRLYAGDFSDADYTDRWLPYLFAAIYVFLYARRTSSQIINFAGTFEQTQWRSVLESVINISVSLWLVNIIGIYGVLIGTIAALLYRTNDVIIYANVSILRRKPWKTYRRWGVNLLLLISIEYLAMSLLPQPRDFFVWILTALAVSMVTIVVFLSVDTLFDKYALREIFHLIRSKNQKINVDD